MDAPQLEISLLPRSATSQHTEPTENAPQHDAFMQDGPSSVISMQSLGFQMENFHRMIHVVKSNGRDSEDVKVTVGLFDSGSHNVNLISEKLARDVNAELRSLSILSQVLDMILPRRRKAAKALEKLRGANGASIHQQGTVKIRWYCLDQTPYRRQVLWFHRKAYVTEHYVVKNVPVGLVFSIRTWDELGLREGPSPVCIITKSPELDMSPQNLAKMAAEMAAKNKKRTDKKIKEAFAHVEAKKAEKTAKK